MDYPPWGLSLWSQPEPDRRNLKDVIHFVERIENVIWVLEDRLHIAMELPSFASRQSPSVLAPIQHLAFGGRSQYKKKPAQGGLATTTLANHSSDRSRRRLDGQREAVERDRGVRLEQSATEALCDLASLDQRTHFNTSIQVTSDPVVGSDFSQRWVFQRASSQRDGASRSKRGRSRPIEERRRRSRYGQHLRLSFKRRKAPNECLGVRMEGDNEDVTISPHLDKLSPISDPNRDNHLSHQTHV